MDKDSSETDNGLADALASARKSRPYAVRCHTCLNKKLSAVVDQMLDGMISGTYAIDTQFAEMSRALEANADEWGLGDLGNTGNGLAFRLSRHIKMCRREKWAQISAKRRGVE